jgi:hypothetical protein
VFALHLVRVLLHMQNRYRVLQHTALAPFALALLRVFRLLALFFVGVVGAHFLAEGKLAHNDTLQVIQKLI